MRAAERFDAGERHRGVGVAHPVMQDAVEDVDAVREGLTDRDGDEVGVALILEPLIRGAGVIVINPDHSRVGAVLAVKDTALDRDVAGHIAVAVEMIAADVDQHGNVADQ